MTSPRGRREDWTDAAEPDPGITLLELLAYVGDLLSYYQDAVADEARLRTRRRYAVALAMLTLLLCWRRCRGAGAVE